MRRRAMNWRESTHSIANGQCVEVANDWRKSSRSMTNGNCVEVGHAETVIAVRDTTDRDGVTLTFFGVSWGKFVDSLK
jgi:hypothetical protein